jgi:hypothetical protein
MINVLIIFSYNIFKIKNDMVVRIPCSTQRFKGLDSQIIIIFHGQNMWKEKKINIMWFLQGEGDKVIAPT